MVDLRRGAAADLRHALAAIYLGVSLAFGHRIVAWADREFTYRFARGPKPAKGPRYGAARARAERSGWYRHLLAWAIAAGAIGFMHLVGGNREETEQLFAVLAPWLIAVVIDFVWSFSYTLAPRRPPQDAAQPEGRSGTPARRPTTPPSPD